MGAMPALGRCRQRQEYNQNRIGRAQGLDEDIAKAPNWYERAKEIGATEAPHRLEMLKSREQ
jgi:hypothetical protein